MIYKLPKPEGYVPPKCVPVSKKEQRESELRIREARKIGIQLGVFDTNTQASTEEEQVNPYREQAYREFILNNKPVPEKVIQQIKEYDKQHNIKVEYT